MSQTQSTLFTLNLEFHNTCHETLDATSAKNNTFMQRKTKPHNLWELKNKGKGEKRHRYDRIFKGNMMMS